MIVLEGPDGSGKSTLYQHLRKEFRHLRGFDALADLKRQQPGKTEQEYRNLFHTINLKNMVMGALERDVCPNRLHAGKPEIFDRLFFSELVYGPLLRESCQFDESFQEQVYSLWRGLNVLTIVCLPPLDVVRQNVSDTRTEQMGGVSDNIADIYELYEEGVCGGLGARDIQYVCYDYTRSLMGGVYVHPTQLGAMVQRNINLHKERSPWL